MQWEYKTRTVRLSGGNGHNDSVLRDEARPASRNEDWWEIFSVQPLGGDQYRLFLKRQVASR